ncbi:MAG: hypothetical protein L6Q81_04150 [Bacteroidia bacterium]|nr:hypothetical protein [Bacteroidia bacterium]
MILLHISSPDVKALQTYATLLLQQRYVADVRIDTIRRLTLQGTELVEVPRYLLACKTKALLFTPIVKFLSDLTKDNIPEIYALPLVSVEKNQEEIIRDRTRAV